MLNIDAKRRIAQLVAREVPDGASLFFGIGTTPEQCALALADHSGLRVMTNNLNVAMALSAARPARSPSPAAACAPRSRRGAGEAHGFFGRFAADIGIYGVGGVAEDGTLLDFGTDEVTMRTTLTQHCRQRFLVLDHSKFGRGGTVRGGNITEASVVFTDRPRPPPSPTACARPESGSCTGRTTTRPAHRQVKQGGVDLMLKKLAIAAALGIAALGNVTGAAAAAGHLLQLPAGMGRLGLAAQGHPGQARHPGPADNKNSARPSPR